MTDKAISPLRRRMIEDMTIRKFAPKTQHDYVQRVKHFAAFLGRSPDTASFEDVRRYQLHLAASGAGVSTQPKRLDTAVLFQDHAWTRQDIVNHTQFIHVPRKLPVVLSPEEVARFLDAAPGLKYKVALSVAYGAGLRVSEVVALKVSDIDSKRMVIRIEQGKGHKGNEHDREGVGPDVDQGEADPSTAIDPLDTSRGVQAGSMPKARNSHSPSCRRSRRVAVVSICPGQNVLPGERLP